MNLMGQKINRLFTDPPRQSQILIPSQKTTDPAFSEDLATASLPSDKCTPLGESLIATSPPTKMHHAYHRHASTLNTAEWLLEWLNELDTPRSSTHPPSNTSCK